MNRTAILLSLLLLIACGPPLPVSSESPAAPSLGAKTFDLSCAEAHRYAARALKTRGYRITAVDRAPTGGTVEGVKDSQSSRIRIQCGAAGVSLSPSGGGAWVEQGLRFSFNQLVEFGDKVWPVPISPVVALELIQGPVTKLDFPQELEPLGVTAVRVRVFNGGERTVRVNPAQVGVLSGSGGRMPPLSAAEVKQRLRSMDPEIEAKLLRPAKLQHGESTSGFVFFRAGAYPGGFLMLVDDQTGEADEFDVSFAGGS